MIALGGSNGDDDPKSMTNPVFLEVLCQVTVVPTVTAKSELALAPGIPGVAEADAAVRFTSTTQGLEFDPHVFPALAKLAGFPSVQVYFPCGFALRYPAIRHGKTSTLRSIASARLVLAEE